MTIDKFMSMLSEESLYFPNIYLFKDDYEGALSEISKKEVYKTNLLQENTPIVQDEIFFKEKERMQDSKKWHNAEDIEKLLKLLHSFQTLLNDFSNHLMFCNSWFLKETESHSMWAEYGDKSPTSIAIVTTIDDLIKSFGYTQYHIHVGKVKYKNYQTDDIEGYEDFTSIDLTDPDNVLELFYAPIMHKRDIYDDEHEVRAIISFESICQEYCDGIIYTSEIPFYTDKLFETEILFFDFDKKTNLMAKIPREGIPVRTNIRKLIGDVVVSPYANDYFYELVKELVENNNINPKRVWKSGI